MTRVVRLGTCQSPNSRPEVNCKPGHFCVTWAQIEYGSQKQTLGVGTPVLQRTGNGQAELVEV
jgi:hypothetical protein